jgi:hypothetical protein
MKGNMFKPRKFKIMEALATHRGAHVRFRGQWLVDAGFHVGARFTLTCPKAGTLILQVDQSNQTQQVLAKVMDQLKLGIA